MKITPNLSVAILWAALPACMLGAQEFNASRSSVSQPRPTAIRELELQPQRILAFSLLVAPVSAFRNDRQDLSKYREFQFGMNLQDVAALAKLKPTDARVIHQRPAVIEELEWQLPRSYISSPQTDPVKEVLFTFYNGQLFRMVINYDRDRTAGMTDADMIDAISTKYGTATRPVANIVLFSSFHVYDDSEAVIARWENPEYSFNLFRSSYESNLGMLVISKRLDALAQAAIAEAVRLDEQEAPAREIERKKKQDADDRAEQEKARLANKHNFRP